MVELLYGTGLRVSECCTLRVRDVDFDRGQLIVRGGKGDKDPSALDLAIRAAARKSGITKRVTAHTFRHSFATHARGCRAVNCWWRSR